MSMPTDNSKDFFIKDFYQRTLEILKEYNGKYDVTLLINSMLGLLVVPKERFFTSKNIPDSFVSSETLIEIRSCIKSNLFNNKENTNNSLKEVIRHLRNAVSHGHLRVIAEKPVIENNPVLISSINFVDEYESVDKKTNQEITSYFEIELNIELLRKFLEEFITNICSEHKTKRG